MQLDEVVAQSDDLVAQSAEMVAGQGSTISRHSHPGGGAGGVAGAGEGAGAERGQSRHPPWNTGAKTPCNSIIWRTMLPAMLVHQKKEIWYSIRESSTAASGCWTGVGNNHTTFQLSLSQQPQAAR